MAPTSVSCFSAKGYTIHGIIRCSSSFNTGRIDHIYQDPHQAGRRLNLHYGDLTDSTGLRRILEIAQPDEVYNLGAQSHVKVSFENPEYTADSVATGPLRHVDDVATLRARRFCGGHWRSLFRPPISR